MPLFCLPTWSSHHVSTSQELWVMMSLVKILVLYFNVVWFPISFVSALKLFSISVMRQRKLKIKVLTGSVIPQMQSMSAAELRSVSGQTDSALQNLYSLVMRSSLSSIVSFAAVFVVSRNASPSALRDIPKDGCEGDDHFGGSEAFHFQACRTGQQVLTNGKSTKATLNAGSGYWGSYNNSGESAAKMVRLSGYGL